MLSAFMKLIFILSLSHALPTPQESQPSSANGANQQATSKMFSSIMATITKSQVNDKCVAKLKIFGNGIDKSVDYPCDKAPNGIINQGDGLAVGDEWFTDEPKSGYLLKPRLHRPNLSDKNCSKDICEVQRTLFGGDDNTPTLIHLTDDKCEKEVFTNQGGQASSTTTLSEDECKKVREKMSNLKKEQDKWVNMLNQQQAAAQQQIQQLQQNMQQNFQWLQSQMGGIFNGK